jgi:hypothetical protein
MQRTDTAECRKDARKDIPSDEFQYRRGFAAGLQTALGIMGRGDRQRYSMREILGAGGNYLMDVKDWRDYHPAYSFPPRAPLQYPSEGPPLWTGPDAEHER